MTKIINFLLLSLFLFFSSGQIVNFDYIYFLVFILIAIFMKKLRTKILLLSLLFMAATIYFYINNDVETASIFGSKSYGGIFLLTVIWLPEIFEKGYVSDLKKWFKE